MLPPPTATPHGLSAPVLPQVMEGTAQMLALQGCLLTITSWHSTSSQCSAAAASAHRAIAGMVGWRRCSTRASASSSQF